MNNQIKLVACASIAALFVGCTAQTATLKRSNQMTPSFNESQAFFVGGIGQSKVIDAAKVCGAPQNVSKVQSKAEPVDVLLTAITFGIYSPRTAKVFCN